MPLVTSALIEDHLSTDATNNFVKFQNQPTNPNFISNEFKTQASHSLQDSVNQPSTSAVISYDIGDYIGKSIDDFTKQLLLLNHWKPPKNYEFPYSEHNKIYKNKIDKRYASQKHLDTFEWLVLSNKLKGYFCKYCFLFATKGGYKKQTP